jgi:hypothetical protein
VVSGIGSVGRFLYSNRGRGDHRHRSPARPGRERARHRRHAGGGPGSGFGRADQVKVGGKELLDETNESSTRITGRNPEPLAGFYGVELLNGLGVRVASLDRAVEVTAPVTLTSVSPKDLSAKAGRR